MAAPWLLGALLRRCPGRSRRPARPGHRIRDGPDGQLRRRSCCGAVPRARAPASRRSLRRGRVHQAIARGLGVTSASPHQRWCGAALSHLSTSLCRAATRSASYLQRARGRRCQWSPSAYRSRRGAVAEQSASPPEQTTCGTPPLVLCRMIRNLSGRCTSCNNEMK